MAEDRIACSTPPIDSSPGGPGARPALTRRQLAVLRLMRDDDEELVYSKGVGYVDYIRVAPRTVFALLGAMAISLDQFSRVGECERYSINETGRGLLDPRAGAAPQATVALAAESKQPDSKAGSLHAFSEQRTVLK